MTSIRGVVPIENEKRVNWNKIRAEYIGGGISQRKLAEKHGVPWRTLQDRAKREGWKDAMEKARAKAVVASCQKTAQAAADNATLAANIKRMGLEIIAGLFADYAENVRATEHRENSGGVTDIKRLRDLTAAYKDLTGDIVQSDTDNGLLQSLMALERGHHD